MSSLEKVFGIATKPVESYHEREQVDGRFVEALHSHHHIVIYGSSKQGKTALRQKHIEDDGYIKYCCGPRSTAEDIYQFLLNGAGVRLDVSEAKSSSFQT